MSTDTQTRMNRLIQTAEPCRVPVTVDPGGMHTTGRAVRLAKNSLANLLRLGAGWLVLLIVPPLLVRLLDRDSYATWMLVLQVGAYATLFDGGLQLAISRFVARAETSEDPYYLGKVLSSAAALLAVVAGVVCIGITLVAFNFNHLFRSIPVALIPEARLALLLVGISLGIAIPFSVLAGLCLGLEKNQINAAAATASKLVASGGILWAAFHHQGLVRMALWAAVGTLVQPLLFVAVTHRYGVRSLLKASLICRETARQFSGFCAAMMASQFSMLLITGLDLPIVAASDFKNAGYYALATMVSNMLVVPFGAILLTIVPMMSSMSAGEPAERMGRAVLRATRLATALLLAVTIPLMFGMPLLLRIWVGQSYAAHTVLFGEILVAAQVVRLTLMPFTVIGFSAGEQGRMLASPIIEGVVNLGCSLILVRSYGAMGVALGTLIGAFVGIALHFLVSMARTRIIRVHKGELLWLGILRPIVLTLVPLCLLAAFQFVNTTDVVKSLFLSGDVALLCALLWKYQLDPGDRSVISGMITHLLHCRLRERPVGA